MKTDYQFASIWGVVGMTIGIGAFLFNYHMVPTSLPGYALFTAPAMLVLSFFSEETYFTPKMILFLAGQFVGYFCLAYAFRKIIKKYKLS